MPTVIVNPAGPSVTVSPGGPSVTISSGNAPAAPATPTTFGAVMLAGDLAGTAFVPEVVSTHLSSPLPLAQGGTGQSTAQAAINALTGTQSAGKYLRSNGTNATLSALQAADLPSATTSTQGAVALAGDLAGTSSAPTVAKIQGTAIQNPPGVNTQFLAGDGTWGTPLAANTWLPADSGNLAWTFDLVQLGGSTAPTTGVVYLLKIPVRSAISVTNIELYVNSVTGVSLTANQCFVGLYSSSGSLIGQSADLSTDLSSGGTSIHKEPLVSGPFNVSAGFVWAAILLNGTTIPTLGRSNTAPNPAYLNKDLTAATYRVANLSGTFTSLPASFTPANNLQSTVQAYWVGLS